MSSWEHLAERRRSSAAHVRSILDNTLDAVIALDAQGRVTFWNPQAEQTFALPRDKALGRELAELILPGEARDSLRDALALLARESDRSPDHRTGASSRSAPSRGTSRAASTPTASASGCCRRPSARARRRRRPAA